MPNLYDIVARVPALARLRAQRDEYAAEAARLRDELERRGREARELEGALDPAYSLYPPGHFYSPQPDLDEVRRDDARIWPAEVDLVGIDVREGAQLELLAELPHLLAWWPYDGADLDALRYRPDNDYFGHTDGRTLSALLRRFRPRRYLEIGSGWSSALVLDLLDADPDLAPDVTFVEPYPERLHSLLRPGDLERFELVEARAQDLELERFTALEAGDVLVIDSTHVSKVGSDVNRLFLDVLPRLAPGVVVHVHDVIFPFEYGRDWVFEGRAWNEAYLLRALLIENPHWELVIWPSMLWQRHESTMRQTLGPTCKNDSASLWLVRR